MHACIPLQFTQFLSPKNLCTRHSDQNDDFGWKSSRRAPFFASCGGLRIQHRIDAFVGTLYNFIRNNCINMTNTLPLWCWIELCALERLRHVLKVPAAWMPRALHLNVFTFVDWMPLSLHDACSSYFWSNACLGFTHGFVESRMQHSANDELLNASHKANLIDDACVYAYSANATAERNLQWKMKQKKRRIWWKYCYTRILSQRVTEVGLHTYCTWEFIKNK